MPSTRLIAVYLTVFGMELSCIFAVLQVVNQSVNNQLSPAGLLAILVLSFGVFKALRRRVRFGWLATTTGWIFIWPLVTLVTIKIQLFAQTPIRDPVWLSSVPLAFSHIFIKFEPALLLIICSALLWWLGEWLAVKKLDFTATVSEFQFGLIVLVLLYFFAYVLKSEIRAALPVILIFFNCGLVGISISHNQASKGWFHSLKQWNWSVMLLVNVGLILLAGLIVSILISPELIQLIIKGLRWLWETFEYFMQWLASLFPQSVEPGTSMPGLPQMEMQPETELFHFPEWLQPFFQISWSVMVASLVLLAIWRITSQVFAWMRKKSMGTDGESESLKMSFWQDWLNWLKRLFSGILRTQRRRTPIHKAEITSEAFAIRQIYSQWLRRMASAGYPRWKEQTPLEYQSVVENFLRGQKEAVNEITGEYIRVRYGAAEPSVQEIERMKEQWTILKKADLKRIARDKNNRE